MKILHRRVNIIEDKEYILERHCRINYECDCPWKRQMPYDEYRKEWFMLKSQTTEFYNYLIETLKDSRTICDIIETNDHIIVGYFWVPFIADKESGFCFADIQDIYIEDEFRGLGVASELFLYAQELAIKNGANVIRSGTGCENIKSIKLHEKLGFYKYRYEFEKIL